MFLHIYDLGDATSSASSPNWLDSLGTKTQILRYYQELFVESHVILVRDGESWLLDLIPTKAWSTSENVIALESSSLLQNAP